MQEVGGQKIEPADADFTATFMAWREASYFAVQYGLMMEDEPSEGLETLRSAWSDRAATLVGRLAGDAVQASPRQ